MSVGSLHYAFVRIRLLSAHITQWRGLKHFFQCVCLSVCHHEPVLMEVGDEFVLNFCYQSLYDISLIQKQRLDISTHHDKYLFLHKLILSCIVHACFFLYYWNTVTWDWWNKVWSGWLTILQRWSCHLTCKMFTLTLINNVSSWILRLTPPTKGVYAELCC